MTSDASVLTITVFIVERYVAMCHPLKAQKFANLNRSIKFIVRIYIISLLCALPYPIHMELFYFIGANKKTVHRWRSLWCVTYLSAIFLWWSMFSNYRHLSSLCSPWPLLLFYTSSLRYPYATQHYKEWHHTNTQHMHYAICVREEMFGVF